MPELASLCLPLEITSSVLLSINTSSSRTSLSISLSIIPRLRLSSTNLSSKLSSNPSRSPSSIASATSSKPTLSLPTRRTQLSPWTNASVLNLTVSGPVATPGPVFSAKQHRRIPMLPRTLETLFALFLGQLTMPASASTWTSRTLRAFGLLKQKNSLSRTGSWNQFDLVGSGVTLSDVLHSFFFPCTVFITRPNFSLVERLSRELFISMKSKGENGNDGLKTLVENATSFACVERIPKELVMSGVLAVVVRKANRVFMYKCTDREGLAKLAGGIFGSLRTCVR
ncbi:hypothetical protein B0T10DRAFT_477238 [Thelonectria olida]|uniref:Uncharacterized protein n=1 Tax=Thelonectria olida TaxID=1576542 RepID=A0A9P9ASU9_9HYPO|nr:hypothetical protein B0T10DRAFT_477238 [Thelonectria olida]